MDLGLAARVLGRQPVLVPGAMVRRIETTEGGVWIDQELRPGVVVRLFETRANEPAGAAQAPLTAPSGRARREAAAPAAPTAAAGSERLSRYVGSLRVEITGALPADSLSQLLNTVQ
jgi:hypothetical protein